MKLGKPQPGYADARNVTKAEARATGLDRGIVIFVESGTGLVTFWRSGNGGLDSVFFSPGKRSELRRELDGFWA